MQRARAFKFAAGLTLLPAAAIAAVINLIDFDSATTILDTDSVPWCQVSGSCGNADPLVRATALQIYDYIVAKLAPSAHIDTTNAGNITSGILPIAQASCPSLVQDWDGTAAVTVLASTGTLRTTGSTPIAAARVMSLPIVASYVIGCRLKIMDSAGLFNSTNLVTPTRQSADLIDGATTGTTLGGARQNVEYTASGSAQWTTSGDPSIPSDSAVSNQFITAIPSTGIITRAQPAFSNLSGAATAAQLPATPLSTGTGAALTGPRQYYICTGTCTPTPPVPVAGYEFCILNGDNVATAITLQALGSSAMYENSARTAYGTAGTGTLALSAAAANKVCILGLDSTHYLTVSYNGTVTVN